MMLSELIEGDVFSPSLIAQSLHTTRAEVAETLGLSRDAITRASRIESAKTQTRLREMVEILRRVEPQLGSPVAAYAWFRSEALPGFGDETPDALVRQGKARHVHAYLDDVLSGGFA